MKALVLAGGSGTRMRPITHTSAKQLVPVAGKPVLFYGLEAIAEAGITDVGLIVGETAAEIAEAIGDGSRFGLRLTYIRQERPLGLAHAVAVARDFLADEDFVMYLGDNFLLGGITEVVEDFRTGARHDARILLSRSADPTAFGVAELDGDGRVIGLEEKPRHPKSDLVLAGIYLFTPAVHEAVASIRPSGRGELEITDALQWLIDHGRSVHSSVISGYWKDTGNVPDMLEANRSVLETVDAVQEGYVDGASTVTGRVRIGAGAKIVASHVVGPAVIGPGTEVIGSSIGPYTSVSEDCRIEDSEISGSIVLRGCVLTGVARIEESLIGRDAEVRRSRGVPTVHRLVLGDNSRVQIAS
ncbi:glucose-1-phosphate thymidylyltransferase [Streptomyces alfalfae]|uniref:Glucose-1-phosphate thymidylyltransferase n=1 Tax=Streptomyces alfalfae TaxID=1642299 RepID=A0A1P8TDE6_9ACTN|nr:glucose-1-phosphate thymidylyltransferase [Streptomyces alfalfae]AYA16012.1 glucose-1-phosphate thymidylyltransferase [Streptomyces fradiae]APY85655.1 glucose-1-phosphate thymidylyltransferase [Streptomyces alfalfae]QQC92099.1 glucose-1-phosphate thymidylyltransferase [Streptomyces alfalfae]QUI34619.1 glucose-1-phosphate thymidylyltransferase [Streptomyces alfalfae]RXX39484.1 glucose-1-phosphate thymidylyltransferase [Streptomyces alfalfae]